ncbi:MAG: ABC transporter ATP-binding protein [Bacteroidota bacterium]
MSEKVLQIKGLTLAFDGRKIFDDFDLSLAPGDKVALKGPSGSGKSSLLSAIMGFEHPDSGNIYIRGKMLGNGDIDDLRRDMCWLPQNVAAPGEGKVREVIRRPFTYSDNKGLDPDREDILSGLDSLGLSEDILDKEFTKISGGEKQRVGLLICRLLKRPLLLLDEPTSALDEGSIDHAVRFMLDENDSAVLSTSHEKRWLESCDKIIDIGGRK